MESTSRVSAASTGHPRATDGRPQWASRIRYGIFYFVFSAAHVASAEPAPAMPALDARSPLSAFEQIWQLTQEQIYPPSLVAMHFTPSTYKALRQKVSALDSVSALTGILNPFLDSLGVSHTRLYARHDFEYAFFRSLFSTREPDQPPFSHPGLQLLHHSEAWWVRETLDGFPADLAGIHRGDRLLTLDGDAFDPRRLCDGGERRSPEPQTIGLLRGGLRFTVSVPCIRQNPHASMHDAMLNSVRTLTRGEHRVGYLRLWTGTGAEGLRRYRAAIAELSGTDALILDLRGGFGGAWYEHLDPFFPNRETFFSFTVISRDGTKTYEPEAQETDAPYDRPMAVLINEGTRSGKEAVAFQFRKSRRAALIGTTTRGAFSAGKGLFVDDDGPLVYYLSVAEYRLDGQIIEGVGVEPDRVIPYPVVPSEAAGGNGAARRDGYDPQLASALDYLAGVLDVRVAPRAKKTTDPKRTDQKKGPT